MRFWQVSVIAAALILLSIVTLRWMPTALSATMESEWLAVVIFAFIIGPGAITAGIIYGVWRLGSRGNS